MGSGSAMNGRDAAGRGENLRQALAGVYDACADGLFRYAVMLLADPAAAEDAVQQVFVKLAARGELGDIQAMKGYLRRAVRNECLSTLRRRSRRRAAMSARAWLVAASGSADPPPSELLRRDLERALKALTAEQREVVHLKVFGKLTFPQIAQATGVPANTAASRYRYALAHLRQLLSRHLESER
jgi:RNA polymerase sigma-70 factor (ECF subfamily)